jgi:hypothetical protein
VIILFLPVVVFLFFIVWIFYVLGDRKVSTKTASYRKTDFGLGEAIASDYGVEMG